MSARPNWLTRLGIAVGLAYIALIAITSSAPSILAQAAPPAPANVGITRTDGVYHIGWTQKGNAKLIQIIRHYQNDPNDNRFAILVSIPGKADGSYSVAVPIEPNAWYEIKEISWTDNEDITAIVTGPIHCNSFDQNGVCTSGSFGGAAKVAPAPALYLPIIQR
jgi:hypothetical protein